MFNWTLDSTSVFIWQMTEQSRLHMKDMQVKLEVMDSNSQTRLKQEVSVLLRQMSETQTFSQSAADSLALRIQTLEAQNSKVRRRRTNRLQSSVYSWTLCVIFFFVWLSPAAVPGVVITQTDTFSCPMSRVQLCPRPSHTGAPRGRGEVAESARQGRVCFTDKQNSLDFSLKS